ncbi:MAG: hypothetical protein WCO69_00770 [Candidatus Omnitrophota bacterium]
MLNGRKLIADKKLYKTEVEIFFPREEARLVRRAVAPWEGYLDENFRKGNRTKDGVIVKFLGWELCELAGAVEMDASVADDQVYAKSLEQILNQNVLPAKRSLLAV